jgi:hypothetical protein
LGHFFGTHLQFWLNLQTTYDLCVAEQKTGAAVKTLPTLDASYKSTAATSQGRHKRESEEVTQRLNVSNFLLPGTDKCGANINRNIRKTL